MTHNNMPTIFGIDFVHHRPKNPPVRRRILHIPTCYIKVYHLVNDDILPLLRRQIKFRAQTNLEIDISRPHQPPPHFRIAQLPEKTRRTRQNHRHHRQHPIETQIIKTRKTILRKWNRHFHNTKVRIVAKRSKFFERRFGCSFSSASIRVPNLPQHFNNIFRKHHIPDIIFRSILKEQHRNDGIVLGKRQ